MRGMIKWKPFNTLLNNKDIKILSELKQKIEKPEIMEDRIYEINTILTNSLKEKQLLEIKHYSINMLKITQGYITNINKIEKYILINKTRIYFKNIINIKTL
jgi:hypothetical protein